MRSADGDSVRAGGMDPTRESAVQVHGPIERMRVERAADLGGVLDARDEPLILEGAIEHWPARGADGWDGAGLARRLGPLPARCKLSPSHRHPDFAAPTLGEMFATRASTFGELLEQIARGGSEAARCFLTGDEEFVIRRRPGRPEERNPKLAVLFPDFELPELFEPDALYTVWLWLSGAGVRSWLHYDTNGCHNLNAQVRGSKRVWLFPPEALAHTYPFELGGANPAHNCCRVDIEAPDLERFPDFAKAVCLEGEVRAGDLLFLPADWIHSFLHTGALNVNLNFWWRPARPRQTPVALRQAFLDRVRELRSQRELSAEALDALAAIDRALIAAPLS